MQLLLIVLKACDINGSELQRHTHLLPTNALVWAGINPIFVDIDPYTLTDPNKIKAALLVIPRLFLVCIVMVFRVMLTR